jgi:hypothetical protein
MKRSLWSLAVVVLALGGLAMVGGTAIGGQAGAVGTAYGLLFALCALYMIAGLALRDRVRRRLGSTESTSAETRQLGGLRIF